MELDTTYMITDLRNHRVHTLGITVDDSLHQIINAVNIFREIYNRGLGYVNLHEFCEILSCDDKEAFYQKLQNGTPSLCEVPLGCEGHHHAVHFIKTLAHTVSKNYVDLSNRKTIEPIYCYEVDWVLNLPFCISNKITGESEIYNMLYSKAIASIKEEVGPDEMIEFRNRIMKAKNEIISFIQNQPDDIDFEYDGMKFKKNIPVADPQTILKLLFGGRP